MPFFEKDMLNFSLDSFKLILEKFVELFSGRNFEKIYQPKLKALKYFNYPELHEESMVFIIQHRFIQEIVKISGTNDFSILDYRNPKLQKIKKIFSGIINFMKFKEQQLFRVKNFNNLLFFIKFSILQITSNLRLIKEKIFFLCDNFFDRFICFKGIKTKNKRKIKNFRLFILEFFLEKKKNTGSQTKNFDSILKILEKKKNTYFKKYIGLFKKQKFFEKLKFFENQNFFLIWFKIKKFNSYFYWFYLYRMNKFKKIQFFFYSILNFFLNVNAFFLQKIILNFIVLKKKHFFGDFRNIKNCYQKGKSLGGYKFIQRSKQKRIKFYFLYTLKRKRRSS
ncbi:hypothetical protein CMESO_513 (nucleomorph) [Chroomonas mesostigmatica CCMP1168]|uniref:Kinetochore protein Nuf2 N-terminal domain-containing protein n=1 Tax=Chroomonas mesostigmatica CCMP1168 TaxID=1195612 RepID=J7G2G6_9CRYP|nr:hypothetical protein CMESO_513 [Chroomonas mesostigmatica CCMP1168]